MANSIERMIADTFMEMAQGLETGSFGKRPKVALTGMGSAWLLLHLLTHSSAFLPSYHDLLHR